MEIDPTRGTQYARAACLPSRPGIASWKSLGVMALFSDARVFYDDALEVLAQGKVCNAVEGEKDDLYRYSDGGC